MSIGMVDTDENVYVVEVVHGGLPRRSAKVFAQDKSGFVLRLVRDNLRSSRGFERRS